MNDAGPSESASIPGSPGRTREHRRRRMRRRSRRAYIRSVHFLPSMATLGNAVCGFGAMYVAALPAGHPSMDPWTNWFAAHQFSVAGYMIFVAMIFDALDGRLARFARHTTDFGGQLDSMADVISFGAAPAFIMLYLFRTYTDDLPTFVTRAVWAIAALYMSCAAIRLARFNVSNEHGEQHHMSFLGLPSPGAGAAIAAAIILQQELARQAIHSPLVGHFASVSLWLLPPLVLATGLLMVSQIRYPHLVNRYLRGKRSIGRLLLALVILLLLIVKHEYTIAVGSIAFALSGLVSWAGTQLRRKQAMPPTTV